jgi:RNA polymerase sigma-70 factor (ECF subfamily)
MATGDDEDLTGVDYYRPCKRDLSPTAVYKGLKAPLQRYVVHAVGEQAAPDLVQNVWRRVIRDGGYQGGLRIIETSPYSWVTNMADEFIANFYRDLGRREHRHVGVEALDGVVVDQASPSSNVRNLGLLTVLLAALPEAQRKVFQLVEMEGMTREEVAEALGLSPNTVSSRLSRARAALNKHAYELLPEGLYG